MKKLVQIKIGGHLIDVKFYNIREISGKMGETWAAHNIIRICQDYPESQQEVTILHEILHHCLSQLGYEYKVKDDNAIHSEKTVEAIAQSLYQVLKDNQIIFTGKMDES